MHYAKFLFFIITGLFTLTANAQAQSLTEKLNGIETSFKVNWQVKNLKITDQGIYKRGLSRSYTDGGPVLEYGMGYGYGVEVFRLEFITNDEVEMISKRKQFYQLTLVDLQSTVLLKMNIDAREIEVFTNGLDMNIISISLQSVPLIVLNKTEYINVDIISNN